MLVKAEVCFTVACACHAHLLLMPFMPGPGVAVGTTLASASKAIPTALVLVEVLVPNF